MKFEKYKRITCDFTRALDKHLKYRERMVLKYEYCTPTYLMYDKTDLWNGKIQFRFPGATRGFIYLESDLNTIVKVVFDEDTSFGFIGCYELTAKEEADKFIGKRLWDGAVNLNG